jgi:hypothetical protein
MRCANHVINRVGAQIHLTIFSLPTPNHVINRVGAQDKHSETEGVCTKSQAHEVRLPCNIQCKINSGKWVECTFVLQILMKITLKMHIT